MRQILLLCLLASLPAAAFAQHSHGYLFVAPGGATANGHTAMTLQLGAGGDFILGKGIGVGAELGALGPREDFASNVLGVFSANGSYHIFHHGHKADPYVTGGYSLFFRTGTANLGNVGGGVNYWFIPRVGLKVELRDHIQRPGNTTVHYWGVRLGLAFR